MIEYTIYMLLVVVSFLSTFHLVRYSDNAQVYTLVWVELI